LKVPKSLKEEHEAFIDGLRSHSTKKDQTGVAVGQLLKLLEPHIEKEDQRLLPLLGALGEIAAGQPLENPTAVMRAYEKYAAQYPSMFAEHLPIKESIRRARRLAKKGGYGDVVDVLDALAHHSRVEEEVLYPAALLVGMAVRRPPIPTERRRASREAPAPVGAGGHATEPEGGLPFFALDYDAPISHVTKTLMVEHHEIDAMLSEVGELADKGKLKVAISLLNVLSPLILRAAVEEEARVMRVVMQKNKSRTQRSVAIAREHRGIVGFLKHQLPELGSQPPDEARRKIVAFVGLTRTHLKEEEEVSFPLAASE
jgi:hemerythrin-like domain-containing protein